MLSTGSKQTPHETWAPSGPGSRLAGWDPADEDQWQAGGRRVAWRNLRVTVVVEFLGFSVWAAWAAVVPHLADAGIPLTLGQQFWLASLPALVGGLARIPYSFAVSQLGGRVWTTLSALLLVPGCGLLWWSIETQQPFEVLLVAAAVSGLGGGNFASSMTNIAGFFSSSRHGRALGVTAAGGNLGTGAMQAMVALAVTTLGLGVQSVGAFLGLAAAGAAVLAWLRCDTVPPRHIDRTAYGEAVRAKTTWALCALYVGTFGTFVGFTSAGPSILHASGGGPGQAVWVGAVLGALTRPIGGALADRHGGARVTRWAFAVMTFGSVALWAALATTQGAAAALAIAVVLIGSGLGNGSTYKMLTESLTPDRGFAPGVVGAAIGIAGTAGALGGFAVVQVLRIAVEQWGSTGPALAGIAVGYVLLSWLTRSARFTARDTVQ